MRALAAVLLTAALAYRPHPKGGAPCQTDWIGTLGGGCEDGFCHCDAAFNRGQLHLLRSVTQSRCCIQPIQRVFMEGGLITTPSTLSGTCTRPSLKTVAASMSGSLPPPLYTQLAL